MTFLESMVLTEAQWHIDKFHCVKGMDPYLYHHLDKSESPCITGYRNWMRWKAVMDFRKATREQAVMNEEFAQEPYGRRSDLRRRAVLHPYFVTKAIQQGHAWGDKDFVGRVQRDNPRCFPQREAQ